MLKTDTIGERIAAAIKYAKTNFDKDMNQTRLAAYMGVSPQAVHGWVKESKVSTAKIPEIARHCNVSMTWLLSGRGEMYVVRPLYAMPHYKQKQLRDADREINSGVREPDIYRPENNKTSEGYAALNRLAALLDAGLIDSDDLLALEEIANRLKKPT